MLQHLLDFMLKMIDFEVFIPLQKSIEKQSRLVVDALHVATKSVAHYTEVTFRTYVIS